MTNCYEHLAVEERACILQMRSQGQSARQIALLLKRAPSTISRELKRLPEGYDAVQAGRHARQLRHKSRRQRKLAPHTALFQIVTTFLKIGWSPEQIAGTLKKMWPNDTSQQVSHETVYNALYVLPRGELKRELIAVLRRGHSRRLPRSCGEDRRGTLPGMLSIHLRPPQINDRLIPGHWEGDLIKGAANRSSVGTLVERTSRLVLLAKMENATAEAALHGFMAALNPVPSRMRQSLTYDRGKEMARHAELSAALEMTIYFADPHSPWQRGSNENTNGLLRQYLPKGTDLSVYTQDQLEAIAYSLNTRPRKSLGFRTPLEVFAERLSQIHPDAPGIH